MNRLYKKLSIVNLVTILVITILLIFIPKVTAESISQKDRIISVKEDLIDEIQLESNNNQLIPLVTSDHSLEGLVDSVQSYFEVPPQGLNDNSYVELSISYSSLLLNGSSVTINIDDKPIESIALDPKKTTLKIKVSLDNHTIEPGFHHISLSFYGHLEESICVNEDSPANWLVIHSESNIILNKNEIEIQENALNDYPYPYIQENTNNEVQTTIVIPNNASENTVTAALKLSSYLFNQTASEEPVKIVRETDIKHINNHLIAVGATNEWDGVIQSFIDGKVDYIDSNEFALQTFFLDIAEKTKQLLLVTALNSNVIEENISLLIEDDFVKQLSGNELIINELPAREIEVNNEVSFTEFGMPTTTLSGKLQSSPHYFYKIPTYIDKNKNATLHLKLKVSETLFQEKKENIKNEEAELVVYLNEKPHSIKINDLEKTEESSLLEVKIPIDASTFKEDAYLSIKLKGNGLRKGDFCSKPTDAYWIYIQDDSYIDFNLLENKDNDRFLSWPSPFDTMNKEEYTSVIIPDEIDDKLMEQIQSLVHQIGSHSYIDNLHFVFLSNVTDELLIKENVIIINNDQVFETLLQGESSLLINKNDNDESLHLSNYGFMSDLAVNVSWIQPSIWNSDKAMVIFSPVHFKDEGNIIGNNIIKLLDEKSLNINVIVENKNGELFTNQLDEKEIERIEEKGSSSILNIIEGNKYIPFVFGGVVIISIIIFFYALRKKRKRN